MKEFVRKSLLTIGLTIFLPVGILTAVAFYLWAYIKGVIRLWKL